MRRGRSLMQRAGKVRYASTRAAACVCASRPAGRQLGHTLCWQRGSSGEERRTRRGRYYAVCDKPNKCYERRPLCGVLAKRCAERVNAHTAQQHMSCSSVRQDAICARRAATRQRQRMRPPPSSPFSTSRLRRFKRYLLPGGERVEGGRVMEALDSGGVAAAGTRQAPRTRRNACAAARKESAVWNGKR